MAGGGRPEGGDVLTTRILGGRFQQVHLAALLCSYEAVARRETAQKQLIQRVKESGTGRELLIDTPNDYQQKHSM